MDLGLTGRKAIITGGSRGIGRRTADVLADEGTAIGLCARSGKEVDEAVVALEARGVTAFGRALDVADAPALSNWVADAAVPFLRESDAPAIVVVSTVAAIETGPFEGAYGTLKAALIRYAAGMASVLAADGIRVNTVSPGTIYIEDGFWGGISRENPEFFAQAEGSNPLGRMGTPGEVARAIAFLASPAASFITGTNLLVDAGLTRGVQF